MKRSKCLYHVSPCIPSSDYYSLVYLFFCVCPFRGKFLFPLGKIYTMSLD